MAACIFAGCDLHVKRMLLRWGSGQETPKQASFLNTDEGRRAMVLHLWKEAKGVGARRVVAVYEASSLGFGLHDELRAAGVECHVLAPHRIAPSWKHRAAKTDERDAQLLLEMVRGFVLAGNPLPAVWVPDRRTRDDREATRTRTDLGDKRTAICNQVQGLLKRHGLRRPETTGEGWTAAFRRWLDCLAAGGLPGLGVRGALGSLLRQLAFIEAEIARSEEDLERLAGEERYAAEVEAMTETSGVGVRVALTVLTELGDLERFTNRRQVGAFLGLVPQSDESGEASDRKGHITHQGPPQVRRMLCQAVLSWVRYDPWAKARYEHLVGRPKKGRKIAKVAMMRLLGIRLWRRARGARRAVRAVRSSADPGGGRP